MNEEEAHGGGGFLEVLVDRSRGVGGAGKLNTEVFHGAVASARHVVKS